MRSILQNVAAYDIDLKQGLRIASVHQTITAPYQIAQDQNPQLNVIASGGGQTVVMPSISGTSFSGTQQDRKLQIVANVGVTNNITVNAHADDSSTQVAILAPGEAVMALSSVADSKWIVIAGAGTSTGITLPDGENIVLGTVTGSQIGTSTTQKLGFFGATPIVQPGAISTVTGTQPALTSFGFTTTAQFNAVINSLDAVIAALTNLGLI